MKKLRSYAIILLGVAIGTTLLLSCSDDNNPANSSENVSTVFLKYELHYFDLDSGAVDTTYGAGYAPVDDFNIAYNSGTAVHSRLFQTSGRQVKFFSGRPFSSVHKADADTATFATTLIDLQFDNGSTFLVKTDLGAIYKVGNPVEDSAANGVTLDYAPLE